jgi:hypothetical protein
MAFSAVITLTTAGADTGPFSLYSDIDGFVTPFETGVGKAALEAGYLTSLIPDGTSTVRVKSVSLFCTNYINLALPTTTTTTSTSTTTTTTTLAPGTVVIDACAGVQADISGNVTAYAYASIPVATNVTVDLTWTAADLSTISGTVTILSGETCGTVTLTGADPSETGANLEITAITPGSFGGQTYTEGTEVIDDVCTTCPAP